MQQRTPHRLVGLAAALLLTLAAGSAGAKGNGNGPPARAVAGAGAAGEVIVRFKAEAPTLRRHALTAGARGAAVQAALDGRAAALGARQGRSLVAAGAVSDRTQVVRAVGVDAATLARQLAADPEVEWAEPNGIKRRLTAPNDPLYAAVAPGLRPNGPDAGQWYLRAPDSTLRSAINIEAAWTRLGSRGSNDVVVAVLDTGVRFDHPELARVSAGGRLLDGYDFVANDTVSGDGQAGRDADPSDPGDFVTSGEAGRGQFTSCTAEPSSWHGTATASLIGALTNNGVGMAGAAPGTRVLPLRVLGKCFGVDSDIQAAMRWAAGISVPGLPANPNPAKVINMSLGGGGACSAGYQTAVNDIIARGVTIVAAAGNTAGGPVNSPANCTGVISVLALRHAGTKVGFSDLGPEITIAAPGGNCINITAGSACLYPILAASNLGTQGPLGASYSNSFDDVTVGTSFSSPLVAATVALMVSAQPMLTVDQVRNTLRSTARAFPTTGADNGPDDPTPVEQCLAPQTGVEQFQCYCTTALCGAGMMDAGAAVAAVANTAGAVVTAAPSSPVAGNAITFSSTGSFAQTGATIASYSWTLLDGGGIATGFSSATNAATATLTPSAAGTLRVRLTITDSLGGTASGELSVAVAAVPSQPPVQPPPPSSSGGGAWPGAGGAGWLLGLGLIVLALARTRRR
jgi:serine protease